MKNFLKIVAVFFVLLYAQRAEALNRWWNPYAVTGAVSGTGGVCRLTISPAITGSGLLAGNSVTTTSITGATGCNVTATISTVVDTTHIELTGTTFGGTYVSGGCVAGGNWTSTNTSNWAGSSTATCGSGGSSVPASISDTVTLDANTLGSDIIVASTINGTNAIGTLTTTAFVGTLDFSVNNPSITMNNWAGSGSTVRSISLGSGTFTFPAGNVTAIDFGTNTNMTFNAGTSTIVFSGTTAGNNGQTFNNGALTWYNVQILGRTNGSNFNFGQTGSTFNSISITGPLQCNIQNTTTITNGLTITGSNSAAVFFYNAINATVSTITLTNTAATAAWTAFRMITFATHAMTATSSFNMGQVTNATITGPSGSGGGQPPIIGGF